MYTRVPSPLLERLHPKAPEANLSNTSSCVCRYLSCIDHSAHLPDEIRLKAVIEGKALGLLELQKRVRSKVRRCKFT